jgi:hypothetical protein
MGVVIQHEDGSKVLKVEISGKLTKEDYLTFVPELEKAIEEHGKISLLFQMSDFHGWSSGALWEDLKFDFRHFNDIERLAMVGEKEWQKGMSLFCKPFTTARIRYFDCHQLDQAWEWVREGIEVEATHTH